MIHEFLAFEVLMFVNIKTGYLPRPESINWRGILRVAYGKKGSIARRILITGRREYWKRGHLMAHKKAQLAPVVAQPVSSC